MSDLKKIYIYCTQNALGFATACLAQGLLQLEKYEIHCNIEIASAIVTTNGLQPKKNLDRILRTEHINDEIILIIDETRVIHQSVRSPHVNDFYDTVSLIAKNKPVAILYTNDDANQVRFPIDSDVALYVAHLSSIANLNINARPLPFAISLDLIDISDDILAKRSERSNFIINNFSITLNQQVRALLEMTLVPDLGDMFAIDSDALDFDDFCQRLAVSSGILAYGGSFYQNILESSYFRELYRENEVVKLINNFTGLGKGAVVFRWDSWRFWEAMIFECAPFQLDFKKYGFKLPVTPSKWIHYIPIDLSSIKSTCAILEQRLLNEPTYLTEVGKAARIWVLENYHPIRVAERFIQDMNAQ